MTITLNKEMIVYLGHQRPAYVGLEPAQAGKLLQSEVDNFLNIGKSWLQDLPNRPLNVLDIGAGIGFGTLALSQYLNSESKFTIIDKSRIENAVYYGFEEKGAAYNDLALSRNFLVTNGIDEDRLTTVDIERQSFPKEKFDLIISCISWGFHYPISTYLHDVTMQLESHGVLYVDLRSGTDGEASLKNAGLTRFWVKEGRKSIATAWKRS